jgi:hypothetical protein
MTGPEPTGPEPSRPEPALAFWRAAREAAPARARVEIDTLIAVAARLMRDTGLSGRPSDFVAEAVRTLADAGELILPSDATAKARRANYDWRCTPALPLFVMAVRAPPPRPPALRREHAWHPDLAFLAAERRLDKPEVWLAIDAWLKRSGGGTDVVSIRERSFEIFHDEKRLDAALGYKFFRTGALTLRCLRCEEVPEPLAARFCRTARWHSALVIENKDTFRSACLINAELRLFAAVVFGEGDAFPKRAPDLLLLSEESPFDEVQYFGDIDAAGFDIAARAEQAVLALGGALGGHFAFRPAADLYRALFAAGTPVGEYGAMTAAARDFLQHHGLERLDGGSLDGRRIPQEALARPALRAVLENIRP